MYARIVNGVAVEIFAGDPTACFHPDLAAQFVSVPDNVTVGSTVTAAGKWTIKPAPAVEPAAPVLSSLEPMDFYLAFTPQERIAIKTSADHVVQEFWDTYQRAERTGKPIDPNAPSVQQGLHYLAQPTTATPPGAGILAGVDRVAQILAGVAQ